TRQFTATGTYTDSSAQDLTSTVTWSSSATGVATIGAGLATSLAQGITTISASLGSLTGSTILTVTPSTLTSIAVTPANNPSIGLGLSQQFTAIGTYTNGSTQDLTSTVNWSTSSTAVATINSAGLATSIAQGSTAIVGLLGSVSG